RKVNVYGTQKGIAIELAVKGDINGTVYVTGTPSIDSTTNILSPRSPESSTASVVQIKLFLNQI
nr:DUF4403 family protein [Bacteroidia bacterium]